jgi:colanic acid biosynthesis glycosyl transferase WcaI
VVQHQYCSSYESGHGRLERGRDDPGTLSFRDVRLKRKFAKYSWHVRLRQEVEYGLKASRAILRARPDVALLCNIPLVANVLVAAVLKLSRQPYVFWHQDVYSAAIGSSLVARLGRPGVPLAGLAARAERMIALNARGVIAITDAFLPLYNEWSIAADRVAVIPNWAALDELAVTEKTRGWLEPAKTRDHVVLYSGTIGVKHDPSLLLVLAQSPVLDDSTVVVVTQGKGRAWLEDARRDVPDDRLILRDYVDYDLLPTVLGSADVLLAVLEPDASRYSVPSKMLSYMCAGRPIVAVMDPANAAAKTVTEEGMGYVVPNGDPSALSLAVRQILDDPEEGRRMGLRARSYAERTFNIDRITDAFERRLQLVPA